MVGKGQRLSDDSKLSWEPIYLIWIRVRILNLNVAGFFNIPSLGDVTLVRNNYQYQGAFTYVKGDHEIKFGADVIRQQFNVPAATLVTDGLNVFGANVFRQ